MKLIAALSSIALVAADNDSGSSETECCRARKSVCDSRKQKQCPPHFRSSCAAFCDTPYDNPRDCSNRGNKNPGIFMPFGSANGDTMGARRDDTAEGPITLRNDVPYFGNHYNNVYFSSNGVISFNQGISSFTSQAFPISGKTMFSPYWSDFNTAIEGTWSYRQLRAGDDLTRASAIVNFELDAYSDFVGTDGVVVTYSGVAHYGRSSDSDRKNDMQAILVHDNNHSFAIFQYGDIEWTTGTASNGDRCDGLGGTPAQVGFNDGYGRYFSLPGSQTNEMQNVDDMTNCKTTGRLIFKIDGETVEAQEPQVLPEGNDISITDPFTGISEYLSLHSDADVSSHGCFCARTGGAEHVGGRPVDAVDAICKEWTKKRQCVLKTGGVCESGDSESYFSDPSDCAGHSGCELMTCQIDAIYVAQIDAYMAANPSWSSNSVCIARSFDPSGVDRKDKCCGSTVETLTAYNDAMGTPDTC